MSFDKINQMAEQVLRDAPDACPPGPPIVAPTALNNGVSAACLNDDTRTQWMNLLTETAERIKKSLS
jgi:hypothetical protein